MSKTVFCVTNGIKVIMPLLARLNPGQYRVYTTTGDQLGGLLHQELDDREPFAFLLSLSAFVKEQRQRDIAAAMAAKGIRAEPAFLVIGRDVSLDDIDAIIQRGNVFFLDYRGKPTDRDFVRFKLVLDKTLLDFENNRKLVDYVAGDLQSFVEQERLRSTTEQMEQLNQELEYKNRIDELTKLLNRKGILDSLRVAKGRATRERSRLNGVGERGNGGGQIRRFFGQLSCMMIDIDNFKAVNDTYGHLVGDEVLRTLGRLFQTNEIFRNVDVCGRYGGEEFIVVLPATNSSHAAIPAEKLRRAVENLSFTNNGGEFGITVSVGIAELSGVEETVEGLIHRADIALYKAKDSGKNRVASYTTAMSKGMGLHQPDEIEELEESR